MQVKSLVTLSAIACLAIVSFVSSAEAQRRRYYEEGGYDHRYGPRGGCLSSNGINATLARGGLYPIALVGQGRGVLFMRVLANGRQRLIATVDGCTGQVLQTQGDY